MEWNLNQTIKDTFSSLNHKDYRHMDNYVCVNTEFHNIDELVDNYTLYPHKKKMKTIDKLLQIQYEEIHGFIGLSVFYELVDKLVNNEELI